MNLDRLNSLKKLYAEMGDIELQRLRATFDDLTPEGQDVLKREMDSRGLAWEIQKDENPEPDIRPEWETLSQNERNLVILKGGLLLDIPYEETPFASWLLEKNGVNSVEFGVSEKMADLKVATFDYERAMAIYGAATEEDREQFRAESSIEPQPIACPACKSEDIMVEGVSENGDSEWLCNVCEHRWTDADLLPDEN